MVVDDSKVVHSQMHKILDGTDFEIVKCVKPCFITTIKYSVHRTHIVLCNVIPPAILQMDSRCTDFEIVKCVKSGESAIEEYEEVKPDVITMDILMPGVDGLKAAKEIIEKWPDARILMVSSLAYDETIFTQASTSSLL